MSKFESPTIIVEYKKDYNPILNKAGKVRVVFDANNFPIDSVFEDAMDGENHTYKVIRHRFIGTKLVAIVVDDVK